MKRTMRVIILFLLMAGISTIANAADLVVDVKTDGTGFLAGDTATISISVSNNLAVDVPVHCCPVNYSINSIG